MGRHCGKLLELSWYSYVEQQYHLRTIWLPRQNPTRVHVLGEGGGGGKGLTNRTQWHTAYCWLNHLFSVTKRNTEFGWCPLDTHS